jgi:hypothetical protein
VCRAIERQLRRLQDVCPSQDGIQGRPELVRHRGEKLVFDPVGVLGSSLCRTLGGDIPDPADDERASVGLERAQTDFDRELLPVFPRGVELLACSHWPKTRRAEIDRAVAAMGTPKPFWHEDVDRFAEQLVASVPKQPLRLSVHQHNRAGLIHDNDRIWRRFEHRAEQFEQSRPPHKAAFDSERSSERSASGWKAPALPR